MDDERWLPMPGYEENYEVSDKGRIRSLTHRDHRNRLHVGRLRKFQVNSGGRLTIKMERNKPPLQVHVVVATAFHGPRPPGLEVRHLDGDCLNNEATNLRWGTHSENVRDMLRHGTHNYGSRDNCSAGHAYADGNLRYEESHGYIYRRCKICDAAKDKRYRDRRKARPTAAALVG